MAKVAVVTRKLPSHGDTVISRIVQIPAAAEQDEVRLRQIAQEALKDERIRIERQFVEFRQAEWKVEIETVYNN